MKPKSIIAAIVIVGVLLLIGGGLYFWKYSKNKAAANAPHGFEPAESVQVAAARTTSWQPTAVLSGTVIALQSVTLSNEIAGTVTAVQFESGSVVDAGQVLLTLDTSTEDAELRSAEANIKVAQANIEVAAADVSLAEANVGRIGQAAEARASSQAELDTARSALDSMKAKRERAAAELDQSRAAADQLRTMIAKKTLRAPFKARAGLRNVHPGQYLAEGASVVGLQSVSDQIYLDFALPQEQASLAKPGMVVMARAPMLGAEPVPIRVVALDAVADPTTRNVRVRSVVSNTNELLRPGMFVDVTAPYGETHEYTVVTSAAVRRASFGDHVFLILPDEKDPTKLRAKQRFVKLGPMIAGPEQGGASDLIVLDGLKPGDEVAANGSFKLREGALVTKSDNTVPPKTANAGK